MPSRYGGLLSLSDEINGTQSHQARIAEEAGACAVMALERVPADIRYYGGVSRMVGDPRAPSIPVSDVGSVE